MPVVTIPRHQHRHSDRARKRAVKVNRHNGAMQRSFSGQTVTLDRFHSALGSPRLDALAEIITAHGPNVPLGSLADISHVSSVRRGICRGTNAQDFGLKSQDRAGLVVLKAIKITRTICECFDTGGAVGTPQRRLCSFLTASVRKNR